MKGRTIALDTLGSRKAAALIVDGTLEDLLIETDAPPPGTIYRARTTRALKGQGGMICDTPDGPAFLRRTKGLAPGQPLLVQVTGHAEPGKAIPVTDRLMFKSRFAIVTPGAPGVNLSRAVRDPETRHAILTAAEDIEVPENTGLILRSACAHADLDAMLADAAQMLDLTAQVLTDVPGDPETLLDGDDPHGFAWREWSDPAETDDGPGSFERHGVHDMLDTLRNPRHDLPGGGHLFIEPTRAMVAIDVNTGRDTSLAAGLQTNIATARALPRLLRLLGLGGQITLDPAPMPKKDRRTFETALKAALKNDSEETVLAGWTPLGNYELQRRRGRHPLLDLLP